MQKERNVNNLFSDSFEREQKYHSDRKLHDTRDFDKVAVEQYRLFCLACYSGDINTVRTLLKHINTKRVINAEIGCHKMPGMEPLVIACFHGYLSIAKELLNAGASVNLQFNNWTPLAAASFKGHLCLVEELIKAGANVNFRCGNKSPIEFARSAKHYDIVDKLEAAGSDIMELPFCHTNHSCTMFNKPHTRKYSSFSTQSECLPPRTYQQ